MILIHEQSLTGVQNALAGHSHAILFSGPSGAGKTHVARYFAGKKMRTENVDNHPYYRLVAPVNNSISIDQIRQLQKFLQLKTPGHDDVRRIAIIENAHTMTIEAQNALLKSLEEPPADTIIILTAPRTFQLRDTIYSRVQEIPVLEISQNQAAQHFGDKFQVSDIARAHAMSGGRAGLLHSLLSQADHPLLQQIQTAKQLIATTAYDRLLKVDELAKQKDQLPEFLGACKLVCSAALHQTVSEGNNQKTQQWHKKLQLIHATEASLPHNPNTKLLLTNLFLQM